jgi:hypothetical protein
MGGRRGACRVLVGRLEVKRRLGRPRRRREDNIKMNLPRRGMVVMTGLVWSRIRTSGGTV